MKNRSTFAGLVVCALGLAFAVRSQDARSLETTLTSILANPPGLPKLPTAEAAQAAAAAAGLNLTDIQGDIVIGQLKLHETFLFFSIVDAATFKSKLRSDILPLVTNAGQMLKNATQPDTLVNIAFSQNGLTALGITDNLNDVAFRAGQFANAQALGDPGTHWVPAFTTGTIHGVFLLASNTVENVDATLKTVTSALGASIKEAYSLQAAARKGNQEGHEHFGFLDGISNPAIRGFDDNPLPGQARVPPGEILLREANDTITRPAWAKDGSFLVFRQLQQLVPEFHKYLTDNPIREPGLTPAQGSDLLGARMMGRWPSGAPVFLSPNADDPELGADRHRNNNFTYAAPNSGTLCPFSAHIRKSRPRADLGEDEKNHHHIVRGSIPYGEDVTPGEAASNTTTIERGMAFVAYQSNIVAGFQFMQQMWLNDPNFFIKNTTGFDPVVGANHGYARWSQGNLDPTNPTREFILLNDFVISRGGEYFFSPSLSAIADKLSA
ncbi:dye-decolorizing peroxidase precursor [Roridomyces roridus]|uniref:Dye-decolorizing peroxidase n=1 Tax=Roridomyces roridus TaxID=1738132 RepID=A0AAD7BM38_9AGAR|nr:dye-decolorizing peroxidase precursor [Roridomyces roridus]